MLRKLFLGLGTAVAALALAGVAYAAVNMTFSASAKPNKANKPTGLKVSFTSADDTPGALQPPIMNRVVIKLPGGKYNASKFPRCKLASLQAKGPNACPRRSKIGRGTGIGLARPVVEDPVNGKLTIFNGAKQGGRDTVLVYVFPDLGPTFVSVGKVIKRRGKYTLDFSIPPIKTLPSAPDASVTSVKTNTPRKSIRKGKRKHYLIIAPRRCKRTWKATGTFYFATGETKTVSYKQRCKKR
ncbi:MAG: hypothetical protein ACRDLQ_03485 [Solirubrobacterales bacterium]